MGTEKDVDWQLTGEISWLFSWLKWNLIRNDLNYSSRFFNGIPDLNFANFTFIWPPFFGCFLLKLHELLYSFMKRFAVNCKVFYVSSLHLFLQGYSGGPQFIEKCEKFILWLQHQSQPHTELAIKNGNGQWKCEHEKLSQKYATSVAKPQRGEKRRERGKRHFDSV